MKNPNNTTGRKAGVLYLVSVVTGLFSLMYVPQKLFSPNDVAATLESLQKFEFLFRLSIISEAICYAAFLLIPFVLYWIFESTNKNYSLLMVLLVAVAVPVSLLAVVHKVEILNILTSDALPALKADQIHAKIGHYYSTIQVAQIFWGLWLFPFGYLIYRSGLLPKILGVFLMLGSAGYVVNFIGFILFPDFSESIFPMIFKLPSSIGEIGTCLWLLIAGIKK